MTKSFAKTVRATFALFMLGVALYAGVDSLVAHDLANRGLSSCGGSADHPCALAPLHVVSGRADAGFASVQNAAPMKIGQRVKHLNQQIDLKGQRVVKARVFDCPGVAEQIHGEIRLAFLVKAVVQHADDVGMTQRCQQFKFLRQRQRHVFCFCRGRQV